MKKTAGVVSLLTGAAIVFLVCAVAAPLWMTVAACPVGDATDPIVVIVNSSNPVDSLTWENWKSSSRPIAATRTREKLSRR